MIATLGFRRLSVSLVLASLLLVGCASTPPPLPVAELKPEPEIDALELAIERIGSIREQADLAEQVVIEVFPLAEPSVADLVEAARAAEARGELARAKDYVNQALELNPHDAELWQLRAELRIGLAQWQLAEADARHAWEIGPRTGPLCARNWITVAMARREGRPAEPAFADDIASDARSDEDFEQAVERCLQRPPERW